MSKHMQTAGMISLLKTMFLSKNPQRFRRINTQNFHKILQSYVYTKRVVVILYFRNTCLAHFCLFLSKERILKCFCFSQQDDTLEHFRRAIIFCSTYLLCLVYNLYMQSRLSRHVDHSLFDQMASTSVHSKCCYFVYHP